MDMQGPLSLQKKKIFPHRKLQAQVPSLYGFYQVFKELMFTSSIQILSENSREGAPPTSEGDLKEFTKIATKKTQNQTKTKVKTCSEV